ncbi:MAG TPA: MEDS domain-containing protein [Candidatus Nitrosocosmicus sp.]|nr:MEDS domain-containing protein [Candidatus Nitrosocosmicus sp.]
MSTSFSSWRTMSESEHLVQFYQDEKYLMNSLINYIGKGITKGDSCIIIATKEHRDNLKVYLHNIGINIADLETHNKYIALDAEETLSQFMVKNIPDAKRFKKVVGGVIATMSNPPFCIRAFGEMVAILWQKGNKNAALQLEKMWNDLAKEHSFSLFCAYPIEVFKDDDNETSFKSVCSEHTKIIPVEEESVLIKEINKFHEIALLQQNVWFLKNKLENKKMAFNKV